MRGLLLACLILQGVMHAGASGGFSKASFPVGTFSEECSSADNISEGSVGSGILSRSIGLTCESDTKRDKRREIERDGGFYFMIDAEQREGGAGDMKEGKSMENLQQMSIFIIENRTPTVTKTMKGLKTINRTKARRTHSESMSVQYEYAVNIIGDRGDGGDDSDFELGDEDVLNGEDDRDELIFDGTEEEDEGEDIPSLSVTDHEEDGEESEESEDLSDLDATHGGNNDDNDSNDSNDNNDDSNGVSSTEETDTEIEEQSEEKEDPDGINSMAELKKLWRNVLHSAKSDQEKEASSELLSAIQHQINENSSLSESSRDIEKYRNLPLSAVLQQFPLLLRANGTDKRSFNRQLEAQLQVLIDFCAFSRLPHVLCFCLSACLRVYMCVQLLLACCFCQLLSALQVIAVFFPSIRLLFVSAVTVSVTASLVRASSQGPTEGWVDGSRAVTAATITLTIAPSASPSSLASLASSLASPSSSHSSSLSSLASLP